MVIWDSVSYKYGNGLQLDTFMKLSWFRLGTFNFMNDFFWGMDHSFMFFFCLLTEQWTMNKKYKKRRNIYNKKFMSLYFVRRRSSRAVWESFC